MAQAIASQFKHNLKSKQETIKLGRLLAALDEQTLADFTIVPLSEVMKYLANFHDINIVIEGDAIKKQDPPVTFKASGLTLGTLLQAIQEQHPQIRFLMQSNGQALILTTKDNALQGAVPFDEIRQEMK